MKKLFATAAALLLTASGAFAQVVDASLPQGVTVLDSAAIAQLWTPASGGLAKPDTFQALLQGNPSKPGPYTQRLRFPAGAGVDWHSHPDSREITVLSGVWRTCYRAHSGQGTACKDLPAGSFYTEPANEPHMVHVVEDVVIQVSGVGPSGRVFVQHASEKHSH